MIKQATVIKASGASTAVPLVPAQAPSDQARVLRKTLVDASERAEQVLANAEQRARELLRDAERDVSTLRLRAEDEGRARGYAEALSRLALVTRLEVEADQRGLERSIEIARILAERLIGGALTTDPSTVAGLASQVLTEVRGARQVELHVHPADVASLQEHQGRGLAGLSIVADATCARGDFRAVTDVGTIEAKLGDRLDLLTAKLAEALRKGA
jgi:flagellar biosynthesis/type III secretory pathway protein FliH